MMEIKILYINNETNQQSFLKSLNFFEISYVLFLYFFFFLGCVYFLLVPSFYIHTYYNGLIIKEM